MNKFPGTELAENVTRVLDEQIQVRAISQKKLDVNFWTKNVPFIHLLL